MVEISELPSFLELIEKKLEGNELPPVIKVPTIIRWASNPKVIRDSMNERKVSDILALALSADSNVAIRDLIFVTMLDSPTSVKVGWAYNRLEGK